MSDGFKLIYDRDPMQKRRIQYHLEKTSTGFNAWNVDRLIDLTRDMPIQMIDPNGIAELHQDHWYFHDPQLLPSPHSVIQHVQLIQNCDLTHPIILDTEGHIMDGMHRVCKAILDQVPEIPAVRFLKDPQPDLIDCQLDDLVYDI